MKNLKNFLILFFILSLIFVNLPSKKFAIAIDENKYIVELCGKNYFFKDSDFSIKLSKIQSKNYHNTNLVKNLLKLNLTNEEILNYLFPESKQIFDRLSKIVNRKEKEDEVLVLKNSCSLKFIDGDYGKCVNKIKFYDDFFNQIKNNNKTIKIKAEILDYKNNISAKKLFCEKGCFSTNFATSSEERKNNIKVALASLDGIIIDEGEVFSFNNLTGERKSETGYKQAKIISNGTFVLGFGGGVCQVSTTLYNACLLSGLEIVESNSHSLPVSYVEPSFDAMVNSGSSDLKVRNNSGGKIIITTSSKNDICKVKIFGLKNKYKITRQSEKISVLSAEQDVVETDYRKYGDYELEIGEEKRISYAKDGFVSRGYLNYYDEKGNLVERKMIRQNTYKPTKGVTIKREK